MKTSAERRQRYVLKVLVKGKWELVATVDAFTNVDACRQALYVLSKQHLDKPLAVEVLSSRAMQLN